MMRVVLAIDIIDHTISEHVEVILASDHLEQSIMDVENVNTIFNEIALMLGGYIAYQYALKWINLCL